MKQGAAYVISISLVLLQLCMVNQSIAFNNKLGDQILMAKNISKSNTDSISSDIIWNSYTDGKVTDKLISVLDTVRQELMLESTMGFKRNIIISKNIPDGGYNCH
jgi:hypothetical protein